MANNLKEKIKQLGFLKGGDYLMSKNRNQPILIKFPYYMLE